MATASLGLANGKRAKAFRAVEAILREDPVLRRVVKEWGTWDGDRMVTSEPATGQMPMIRLSPVVMPNERTTGRLMTATVGVRVEAFVAGVDADDIVNLWDAVEDAVEFDRPFRETTVKCFLAAELGAHELFTGTPGFNAWETKADRPARYLSGDGQIDVRFLRNR